MEAQPFMPHQAIEPAALELQPDNASSGAVHRTQQRHAIGFGIGTGAHKIGIAALINLQRLASMHDSMLGSLLERYAIRFEPFMVIRSIMRALIRAKRYFNHMVSSICLRFRLQTAS